MLGKYGRCTRVKLWKLSLQKHIIIAINASAFEVKIMWLCNPYILYSSTRYLGMYSFLKIQILSQDKSKKDSK